MSSCALRATLLTVGLLTGAAIGQAVDLTGYWQDDFGGRYQVRQVGNTVAWMDDQRPTAQNVFVGTISGDVLSGQWYDLPGAQLQNTGSLSLRIESNDRMVRVFSSINYGGSVITRVGTAGSGGGSCDISGAWRQPLGNEGASIWTFTPLGGGRYSGQEQGLGNARGTAVVTGSSIRIEWTTPDGAYAGVNELTLNSDCSRASGKATFTRGRSDVVPLGLERPGASTGGGGSCDLSGTWRETLGGEGSSSWTFTPLGGGRYSGREQGLGNVTGTAVVSGPSVRIDWVSPDGAYAGVNELTLDPACRVARGKVTFTRGRSDSVPLTLER